jgi:putative Holliday junction resolvase
MQGLYFLGLYFFEPCNPAGDAGPLFFSALANSSGCVRALGLDVGAKTIGVAVTDEAGIAAHPLRVLARAGTASDVSTIQTIVAELNITDVVIGMPYELSGKVGHRARRVLELANALRAAAPALRYHEQDERFTTAEATRVLLDADLSRGKRKQVIDQQAAALILQGWLDAQRLQK